MKLDTDDLAQLAELVAELVSVDLAQLAELVAEFVAQRLREPPPKRYVDAATLALLLEVRRDWIYAHKGELGGFRLGGERGRLRFDLATLADRLAPAGADPSPPRPHARRRGGRRERHRPGVTPVRLIPYHVESRADPKKQPDGAVTPSGALHTGR